MRKFACSGCQGRVSPVLAAPSTSLPVNNCGIVRACTSVICWYPISAIAYARMRTVQPHAYGSRQLTGRMPWRSHCWTAVVHKLSFKKVVPAKSTGRAQEGMTHLGRLLRDFQCVKANTAHDAADHSLMLLHLYASRLAFLCLWPALAESVFTQQRQATNGSSHQQD